MLVPKTLFLLLLGLCLSLSFSPYALGEVQVVQDSQNLQEHDEEFEALVSVLKKILKFPPPTSALPRDHSDDILRHIAFANANFIFDALQRSVSEAKNEFEKATALGTMEEINKKLEENSETLSDLEEKVLRRIMSSESSSSSCRDTLVTIQ